MRSLLNITVLISSVLSIFSASLTLYDVPVLKETISAIDDGSEVQESNSEDAMKRIYTSHDVSNKGVETNKPLLVAEGKQNISEVSENYLEVFGVRVPNKTSKAKYRL